MRRRKETLLERNLIEKGYRLSHKTYEGKYSEKVNNYVYKHDNGAVEYQVSLDRTREKIDHYAFTTKTYIEFTNGILDSLQEINECFVNELKDIYDFTNECAKEYVPFTIDDLNDPFIEESVFDD